MFLNLEQFEEIGFSPNILSISSEAFDVKIQIFHFMEKNMRKKSAHIFLLSSNDLTQPPTFVLTSYETLSDSTRRPQSQDQG